MVKCTKCGKELHNSARFCPECGNAVSQIPAEPKAIPITQNANSAEPKAIPVTQNANSAVPKAIPVTQNANSAAPKAIPVTQNANSAALKAIPVTQNANSAAPKAIPITQNANSAAPKVKVSSSKTQTDDLREHSKAPTDPFDSINKLLGKSGKKVITAIVAVLTAVAVCIGGFFILKDYKGGINAILNKAETETEEEKEESSTYSESTTNSSSQDTSEPENVTQEPETEPETVPDIYEDANGAGSYTLADGDVYVIAIGETVEFELPEQDVGDDYYSISWNVSDNLLKTGGFNNSHSCSGKGISVGEGYVTAQVSWYDSDWNYNSYEIKATVVVTEAADNNTPGNITPGYTKPDRYPGNNTPNNNNADDNKSEHCTHCSGQGTIACSLCKGTGFVTTIVKGNEVKKACTHPQCNDGVKDCPYC
ncbi:MAG: zinc-ribbon domain-containing protein [Ruminococcaceae bacterium]|nr:zinc-ribbon domain-containing protein [Oscillospiraceae bacterium]